MNTSPLKPSHQLRAQLRAMKGRPTNGYRVQRFDHHADRRKPGWHLPKIDAHGFDPLEDLRQWRGPGYPGLPASFGEYRTKAYAEARERAMRPTLGQLRMIEAAIGCTVACDAAVAAWRNV